MRILIKTIGPCLLLACITTAAIAQQQHQNAKSNKIGQWQNLAEGLEFGIFRAPLVSNIGDSLIRVLRIEPQHYTFKLLNVSSLKNGSSLTVKEWCRQNGLIAAINASMYQEDRKTSVSLMRTKTHVNNPRLSKDMTILAFDRQSAEVPQVKIIDRQCDDFEVWKKKYGTLIQSIRMISCDGTNVWSPQSKKWSTAAIGIDTKGNILFIHVGSPYSMHNLINFLKALPLHISRAMYAEGGPQAQLYINIGEHEHEFVGSHEINLNKSSNALFSWPIPNVVGISPRTEPDN
ncbi:MAG: phosphodiester glycosidase family protein [Desulfobacterales bacterium]|jgi:hypothetical protein